MRLLKKTKRHVRNWISRRPSLYLATARPFKGDFVVGPKTDIVVEGFPRSGNSFAEAALRVAAQRPLSMAHHCHAAAQMHGAARWGVPALVVMRDPLSACRSLLMHNTSLFDAGLALEEYIMFHEDIQPVREAYVLADFKAVTTEFRSVLAALDRRFATGPLLGDGADFDEAAVFDKLDETSLERGRVDAAGEPYSPRRSEEDKQRREAEKQRVAAVFEDPSLRPLIETAQGLYDRLSASRDA